MAYIYSPYGPDPSRMHASGTQISRAAELRGNVPVPYDVKMQLNQIVHSGDTIGPYATTPNPYRDPAFRYDPAAEAVIRRAETYRR